MRNLLHVLPGRTFVSGLSTLNRKNNNNNNKPTNLYNNTNLKTYNLSKDLDFASPG